MEAAKKIFCMGFALFKAIDKSMNDAHYTANGGSWGVATRVYTSNHQALHSYLPGAISKTSRLPEGHPKMTSQLWLAIKVALSQNFFPFSSNLPKKGAKSLHCTVVIQ